MPRVVLHKARRSGEYSCASSFCRQGPGGLEREVKSLLSPRKWQSLLRTQVWVTMEAELGTTGLGFGQAPPVGVVPGSPLLLALCVLIHLCSSDITTYREGMPHIPSCSTGTTLPPSLFAEGPLDGCVYGAQAIRQRGTELQLAWSPSLPSMTRETGWGSWPRPWLYRFVSSLCPPDTLPPLTWGKEGSS